MSYIVYIGTYSPNGKGLYAFDVDQNGLLVNKRLACELENAAQLVSSKDGKSIYVTREVGNGPTDTASIHFYKRQEGSADSALLVEQGSGVDSQGGAPCWIDISEDQQHIFVANYWSGNFISISVKDRKVVQNVQHKGVAGPSKAVDGPIDNYSFSGHEGVSHAHMISNGGVANSDIYYSMDVGFDRINSWRYDAASGQFKELSSIDGHPGSGPRHCIINKTNQHMYVVNEESSSVTHYQIQGDGVLKELETVSTLPSSFRGSNFCSAIVFGGESQEYIYAGNRLHNSIACFKVDQSNGTISFIEAVWTRGDFPRALTVHPNGKHIYALNQRNDNVTIFNIDQSTGRLTFTDVYVGVGSPSQLIFVSK